MKKIIYLIIIVLALLTPKLVLAQCNFTGNFLTPVWNCTTQKASVKLRICSGTIPTGEFKLVGTVNGFPVTYYGTVGGALGPCPKTVNWTNIPVGTFTLKINTTLCSSYTVAVTAPPPAGEISITPSRSPFLCQGESITLTASGGSNYSWTGGGQTWTGASITVTPFSTTTYDVTGSVSWQCGTTSKSKSIPVSVTPLVGQVSTPSGLGARCQGSGTDTYTASAADAGNGYAWVISSNEATSPGSISSAGVVTWNSSFSGDATVRVTAFGCNGSSSTASKSVHVNFIPATYNVSAPTTICTGTTTTVTLTGSQSGVAYQLFKDNAAVGSNVNGTGSPLQWTGMTQGTYKVIGYPTNCPSAEMANQRTVGTSPPGQVSITPSQSPFICVNESITLTGNGGSNYSWTSNQGGSWAGSPITVSPLITTIYTLTGTEPNCYTVQQPTLTVTVKPGANVSISPVGQLKIKSIDTQLISAITGSGYNYEWLKDDSVIPGAIESSFSASQPGEYRARITLDGCPKTSDPLVLTKNIKPVANAGLDISLVLPDNSVTLTGSGTDVDGIVAGYLWREVFQGGITSVGLSTTPELSLKKRGIGIYKFQLIVTDDHPENSDADEVIVTINAPPNNYNRITETIVLVEDIVNESDINSLQIPASQKNVAIKYYDGLGRPMQSVSVQGSPLAKDVVRPVVYDEHGRQSRSYLPVVIDEINGYYKINGDIIDEITHNYKGAAANFYADSRPFGETIFEPSPLNSTVKNYGSGNDWKVADKFIAHEYLTNVHGTGITVEPPAEKIIAWRFNSSGSLIRAPFVDGYVETGGYYSSGMLLIKSTEDEEGNEVREYTDKTGRVILKKVQAKTPVTSLNSDTQWALTYYVYDDFGNLRFVFQPVLSARIHLSPDSYVPGVTDLDKLAFQYKYDSRQRLIEKKIPGADPEYMVYDNLNRLVMTQDGNLRKTPTGADTKRQWLFTKYDALNRPVITGIYTHTAATLTQTQMAALISTTDFYESYTGSTLNHGYSSTVFPAASGNEILTVTYYDNYDFRDALAGTASYRYTVGDITGQESFENTEVTGLVTGSKINILESTGYLWNVIYYDQKYRVIQTKSQNHKGGIDRVTNLYDFVKLKETRSFHQTSSSAYSAHRKFDYDHTGRLTKLHHKFHTGPDFVILQNNIYNERGELMTKQLHSRDQGSTYSQSIAYSYNIRGWLDKINDPSNAAPGDLFSMEMKYHQPSPKGGPAQFNGNISEIVWNSTGHDKQSYGYKYDEMNRLLEANYFNLIRTPLNDGNYTEKIGDPSTARDAYDLNGNIRNLIRDGKIDAATYGVVDNLTYAYTGFDNLLTAVDDTRPDSNFDDGFKDPLEVADEYRYDTNGNMKLDQNKGITSIEYNILDLPKKVIKTPTEYVTYTYDASGKKLTQQVFGTTPKITQYLGEYQYETAAMALQFVSHEEGRIVPDNSPGAPRPWDYQYFLKDHLGNVRVSFSEKKNSSTHMATMERDPVSIETEENAQFLNMNNLKKIGWSLANHTPGTNKSYSYRLSGAPGEVVGPAKSLAVNPGDIIDTEVYVKYSNPQGTGSDVGQLLSSLIGAFNLSTTGSTPLDGQQAYNSFNDLFSPGPYVGRVPPYEYASAPKAYLNYILFDENFVLQDFGFNQVSTDASQGTPPPAIDHELLSLHVKVQQKGYLYVYLSNENASLVDVYFDDLEITHNTNIEQVSDYYAFGLAFNSYLRENSVPQDFKFNGKEEQKELDLGWLDFGRRMYQPELGKFFTQDRFAEKYYSLTPYQYGGNNPILFNDINGDSLWITHNMGFLGLGGKQTVRYENGQLYNRDGTAHGGKVKGFLSKTVNALSSVDGGSATGSRLLNEVETSANNFTIAKTSGENRFEADNVRAGNADALNVFNPGANPPAGGSGGTVYWNPSAGQTMEVGGAYSLRPDTNLAHELLGHGVDAYRGQMDNTVVNGLSRDEWQATFVENTIRGEMGRPLREYYRVQQSGNTFSGLPPVMLTHGSPVPPPPLVPGIPYRR